MSKSFDGFIPNIYYVWNQFWFIQIIICICYCIKLKRILPTTLYSKHVAIFQFNFVLLTNGILYIIEMIYTNKFILSFNTFLHHFIAFFIFIFTLFQQDMICVLYLIPYLFHSLYWYLDNSCDYLLFAYNVSLPLSTIFIVAFSSFKSNLSLEIPFVTICLFQMNTFTYFYNDALNLREIETFELMKALILSFIFTTPFHFFIYTTSSLLHLDIILITLKSMKY
ncbi:hypothetical protein I4U23_003957 [Adineta vaga]|nr:hypothetical protein I4U23_003957 [Adineta vaga]